MFVPDTKNLKLEKIGFNNDEIVMYVTSAQNNAFKTAIESGTTNAIQGLKKN